VCSRLVHEVVEVTKLLGSLYLCGRFATEVIHGIRVPSFLCVFFLDMLGAK